VNVVTAPNRNTERRDREERSKRTCVGCGQPDAPEAMVRLVVSDAGEVAVDLAGGAFGRGAHVHPSPRCLDGAPRGLARSFKRAMEVSPSELAGAIVSAAHRRAFGLLAAAARSNQVRIGADVAGDAFGRGEVELLVVARDAKSAASVGSVMHAVANGGAVAFGTKAELGSLVNKSEVGVLGIVSQPIAAAVRSVVTMASSVADRATATEDR
jgi:predicted RNA-binding protein YlxR (DUF448 family)/ribosomal protein L7Ae-like RNA K-turn-binding protein